LSFGSKTGVESGAVVEGLDVIEDRGTSFGEGGEAVVVNQFVFEVAKEAFDKSVIVAVAFSRRSHKRMFSSWRGPGNRGRLIQS